MADPDAGRVRRTLRQFDGVGVEGYLINVHVLKYIGMMCTTQTFHTVMLK